MRSPLQLLALLTLALTPTACGDPRPPRGDIILILAHHSPTTPSPHFDNLATSGSVYTGELLRPGAPLATPKNILNELLTGYQIGQSKGSEYETRPVLPDCARLSGYRVLGVSHRAPLMQELGFTDSYDYGLFGSGEGGPIPFAEASTEALQALTDDYKQRGVKRAPVLFIGDLAGSGSGDLESVLGALDQGLQGTAEHPDTKPRTVLILFTAPDSEVRALVVATGLEPARIEAGVDPRDFFPTIARRGEIVARALLQGVNVPSFLPGRNLLEEN